MTDKRFVRIFAARREWRGMLNDLIGKKVLFAEPIRNIRGNVYAEIELCGEVVSFTDDLTHLLVIEDISGRLHLVPVEIVKVITD